MSEMVEKVAQAVDDEGPVGCCTIGPDKARLIARAAIEALREPTPEMVGAMRDNIGPLVEMWRAAIDAALSEEGR